MSKNDTDEFIDFSFPGILDADLMDSNYSAEEKDAKEIFAASKDFLPDSDDKKEIYSLEDWKGVTNELHGLKQSYKTLSQQHELLQAESKIDKKTISSLKEENSLIKTQNRLVKEESRLLKEENRLVKQDNHRMKDESGNRAEAKSCDRRPTPSSTTTLPVNSAHANISAKMGHNNPR